MTAYIPIADAALDPEAPVITAMMYALRNNPIAITEAASGAPTIVDDALVSNFNFRYITGGALSGSSTNFTGAFDDAFDTYFISVSGLFVNSGTPEVFVRIGQGGSYKSGASDYRNDGVSDTEVTFNSAVGATSSVLAGGNIIIHNPGSTTGNKPILIRSILANAGGSEENHHGFYQDNQNAITDIQFLPTPAATFSGGQVHIFGIEGA